MCENARTRDRQEDRRLEGAEDVLRSEVLMEGKEKVHTYEPTMRFLQDVVLNEASRAISATKRQPSWLSSKSVLFAGAFRLGVLTASSFQTLSVHF